MALSKRRKNLPPNRRRKRKKKSLTEQKKKEKEKKPYAVIHFQGDIRAKHHRAFAALVDEVVINKDRVRGVIVVVTSPGGMVAQYGHAFSQMERLRQSCSDVTVCIDVVAASGGYLMSLPAHKIIAAPFAFVGSVGVVAFVPNARKLLEKFEVQPRTFTAGNLAEVKKYRPDVAVDQIETGAHWSAQDSVEKDLGLIDEIGCSEDYLIKLNEKEDLVFFDKKSSMFENSIFSLASEFLSFLESLTFKSREKGFF